MNHGFYPILTTAEMALVEQEAIQNGSNAEMFMLDGGKKIAMEAIHWAGIHHLPKRVALLIGRGNNGGDAWAAGSWLKEEGFDVRAYPLFDPGECSPLNQKMRDLFLKKKGRVEKEFHFSEEHLILDGLLGTGFKGALHPKISHAIEQANQSKVPILAIDIPSGLDGTTGEVRGVAIEAAETVALGALKSGFFLREGWNHVGKIKVEDFGLPPEWLEKAKVFGWAIGEGALKRFLPRIVRNRHKYQAGYVVGLGGSSRMKGSVKLSGLGALRGGAGIVRLFSFEEIGEVADELIFHLWNETEWTEEIGRAKAVFVGPGLGKSKVVSEWLKHHLATIPLPCVVDADGLQFGAVFPRHAILTPHREEALRLLGLKKAPGEEEFLSLCHSFCKERELIMVLKGAPTFILSAEQQVVSPFGDPGMATAGSGDVLTGLLAALLAQGLRPIEASILGVALHGMAGEAAAAERGSYGMIASDLLESLHLAFLRLM